MSPLAPVAITGIGCITAAGANLKDAMESLYAGKRHPAVPRHFQNAPPTPYPVFEIPAGTEALWNCPVSLPAHGLTRTRYLALCATRQALADAGRDATDLARYRVGVCLGTNVGSAMSYGGDDSACPLQMANPHLTRFGHTSPTLGIMEAYDLSGPSQTVVNACSAGTDALGLGAAWIRNDLCDIVIAGGADAMYEITYLGFIALMISDQSPCKPFDQHRNGLNLGEGAAIFVMESPRLWRSRRHRLRGTLLGYGASADACHLTAPAPDGAGLKSAITEALQSAGRQPHEMAFINAHGTGTLDNDRIESQVLAEVFPQIPFLSTKGCTGHTLGAAGAVEAAFSIACLERRQLPPSNGCDTPDPTLAAPPVTSLTPIGGTLALSQSMAFGGNNAVVVLGTGEWAAKVGR